MSSVRSLATLAGLGVAGLGDELAARADPDEDPDEGKWWEARAQAQRDAMERVREFHEARRLENEALRFRGEQLAHLRRADPPAYRRAFETLHGVPPINAQGSAVG